MHRHCHRVFHALHLSSRSVLETKLALQRLACGRLVRLIVCLFVWQVSWRQGLSVRVLVSNGACNDTRLLEDQQLSSMLEQSYYLQAAVPRPQMSGSIDSEMQSCMDAQALINHPDWLQRVGALMEEIRRTANALGYAIEPGLSEQLIEKTRSMGPYRASTLIDFDRGDPIELHSLFELPLQRAREVEVATPLLERLVVILQELQRRQEKGSLSSSSSARIKST